MKKDTLYTLLFAAFSFVQLLLPSYIYINTVARLLMIILGVIVLLDKESKPNKSQVNKIIFIVMLSGLILASVMQCYYQFG